MSAATEAPAPSGQPAGAPAAPRSRRPALRRLTWPLWILPVLVGIFLYLPLADVGVFAFNSGKSLFVFQGASLRWFHALFSSAVVLGSIRFSFEIAALTVALAVPIGTALGIGLARTGRALASGGIGLIALCIITPEIALAFALLLLFTERHVTLSIWTIVAGHVTFSVPFVTVMARARMQGLNREIEEASMDLGATRWTAIRTVIVPQLTPAIIGSAMLIFVFSFDDFTTSLFLSGVNASPLPVTIYSMIRFGISPEINAFGVLIIIFSVVLGFGSFAVTTLRRGRQSRQQPGAPVRTEASQA